MIKFKIKAFKYVYPGYTLYLEWILEVLRIYINIRPPLAIKCISKAVDAIFFIMIQPVLKYIYRIKA